MLGAVAPGWAAPGQGYIPVSVEGIFSLSLSGSSLLDGLRTLIAAFDAGSVVDTDFFGDMTYNRWPAKSWLTGGYHTRRSGLAQPGTPPDQGDNPPYNRRSGLAQLGTPPDQGDNPPYNTEGWLAGGYK